MRGCKNKRGFIWIEISADQRNFTLIVQLVYE